jgi:hypothetical protein
MLYLPYHPLAGDTVHKPEIETVEIFCLHPVVHAWLVLTYCYRSACGDEGNEISPSLSLTSSVVKTFDLFGHGVDIVPDIAVVS